MKSLTPKHRCLRHTRCLLSEKTKQHERQIFLTYSMLLTILVAGYLPLLLAQGLYTCHANKKEHIHEENQGMKRRMHVNNTRGPQCLEVTAHFRYNFFIFPE